MNEDNNAPLWKRALMKYGLKTVDDYGTPIIVRTPWVKTPSSTYNASDIIDSGLSDFVINPEHFNNILKPKKRFFNK